LTCHPDQAGNWGFRAMVLTGSSATVPSIDREQRRRRRIRRWAGGAILVALAVVWISAQLLGDRLDARESVLLAAWNASWIAAAIWLLTDLRAWYAKLFFVLSVLGSIANASQGLGFWHGECVHHSETTAHSSTSWSYCIPHLGPNPEFR